MINYLAAEYLKYKRTPIKRLFFMLPILLILVVYLMHYFMPEGFMGTEDSIVITSFNWWTVLFVPIGTAFLVGLVSIMEKKAGNYRMFLSRKLSLQKIWISKVVAVGIFMFYSVTFLAFLVILLEMILGGQIKIKEIVTSTLIIWVGSLNLVPIYLFLSTITGVISTLFVGIAGMILGAVMAVEHYWFFVPWSLSLRMLSPILEVHPNGIPLKASDHLLEPSVLRIGLFVSIVYFFAFTFLTSLWFKKKVVE